jgi:hypothetical protein
MITILNRLKFGLAAEHNYFRFNEQTRFNQEY